MTRLPVRVWIMPGRAWLEPLAAASYQRMRREGCPPGITSAGRSVAEQRELLAELGPWLAVPPERSDHVKGCAVDFPEPARSWVRAHPEHGWRFEVDHEPWHGVHYPHLDQRVPRPVPPPMFDPEEGPMLIRNGSSRFRAVHGDRLVPIDPADVAAYVDRDIPVVPVGDVTWDAYHRNLRSEGVAP